MKRDDHVPYWAPAARFIAMIGSPASLQWPPRERPDNVAISGVHPRLLVPANDAQFTPPPEYA